MAVSKLLSLLALILKVSAVALLEDDYMHAQSSVYALDDDKCLPRPQIELESDYWYKVSKDHLASRKNNLLNMNTAKNAILFIGDGMSIATVAAARTYMGQGEGRTGEESWLSFERFPVTGFSKTYCVDRQVADSACSATAYLGGVKGNYHTIGVNAKVCMSDCVAMNDKANHVDSIAKIFMDAGRSAGLVTTTRVTHASPAGVYAHTAARDWEFDGKVMRDNRDPKQCKDTAYQLIHENPGKKLKVILGGGRSMFRSSEMIDEEGEAGLRSDGLDLIQEWQNMKEAEEQSYQYVWNRDDLLSVPEDTDHLLGLFTTSHMEYHLLADTKQPSLAEMVQAAIKILSKDDNGYFLFVEGGRIDHAHHRTQPVLALDETVEFSKAIATAINLTSTDDTLIVVSSDHSHGMSYSGHGLRGNPILGPIGENADDGKPYLTLNYPNGPGYRPNNGANRADVTLEPGFLTDPNFQYPTLAPLKTATHNGEDVGVFALGPHQHLFTGVYEQTLIPYMIGYAACVNDEDSACS